MLKIEEQRHRILRLEEETNEMQKKEDLQKQEQLRSSPKNSPRRIARSAKLWEDRLVTLTQSLSNIQSTNAKLQETINSRRLERHLLVNFMKFQINSTLLA